MMSPSLIGFNLLSRQGFYVQDNCDLDFRPTDPKIKSGIMAIHVTKDGLPRLNKFEVNERTRLCLSRTDDMRHNII